MARRKAVVLTASEMPSELAWSAWREYVDPGEDEVTVESPLYLGARRKANRRIRDARRTFLGQLHDLPDGAGVFEFIKSHGLDWSDLGTHKANAAGTHIYESRGATT